MVKTTKVVHRGEQVDDHSWALALSDSERIDLATKLTRDLWCTAHGGTFPALDRMVLVRVIVPDTLRSIMRLQTI